MIAHEQSRTPRASPGTALAAASIVDLEHGRKRARRSSAAVEPEAPAAAVSAWGDRAVPGRDRAPTLYGEAGVRTSGSWGLRDIGA
jgi:hypothetical protein